jgi:RHS repeat-associated protein
MPGRSSVSSAEFRYRFTGKERDVNETGWDYFGARYYDSRIGRWLGVDPLAGKYSKYSPYNYSLNNPLVIIDPNGMETDWYLTNNGVPTFDPNVQSKEDINSDEFYIGDAGQAINEQTGELYQLNSDGTYTAGPISLESPESSVTGESTIYNTISNGLAGPSVGNSATEAALKLATDISEAAPKLLKTVEYLGTATGVASAVVDGIKLYNNPNWSNAASFAISATLAFSKVNPVLNIAITAFELSGYKDKALKAVFNEK